MNRQHWLRIVALPVALLLVTAGCGGNAPAATKKRLGGQGPCDLAKVEDLEKIFGPVDRDPGPHQEGPQCFYTFEKGGPAIGRRADAARHGTAFDIDGVTAKRFEANGTCAIDVWLVPDDINQQFGVVNIAGMDDKSSCDLGIMVARVILDSLPG
jgi:hypothetical protein